MVRGDGYTIAEAARRFNVSRATAGKWVRRYDEGGRAALMDRDSRPRSSPTQAAPEMAVVTLRKETGLGPHRIAEQMDISPSTTYAVLRRAGLTGLCDARIVRYERASGGSCSTGSSQALPRSTTYWERLGFEHNVAVDDPRAMPAD